MSITISNCNEICNSPVNSSKSKMLFSFPKSSRFPQRKKILNDKFYDPNCMDIVRKTSFGYGTKYDFTKDSSCAPPPNVYNLKDEFSKNIKKGFGFGQGRTQMTVTGPLMETIRNKNPGPGSYSVSDAFEKRAFTFTGKLDKHDKQKGLIPGPGKYPVSFCINQKGNYFLSKYKNSGATQFSKVVQRCKTSQSKVPGPGYYDMSRAELSPTGKYALSKIHNCTSRKFEGFCGRGQVADLKNTPGPGNYKLPSQFGHYISKKASKSIILKTQNKQNINASRN